MYPSVQLTKLPIKLMLEYNGKCSKHGEVEKVYDIFSYGGGKVEKAYKHIFDMVGVKWRSFFFLIKRRVSLFSKNIKGYWYSKFFEN